MAELTASHPLVWIDCEVHTDYTRHACNTKPSAYTAQMTGLDVDNDAIIEIFCIITNGNLDVIDEEGWGAVIHQSKEKMDKMV
jgi:oligoribonuclease